MTLIITFFLLLIFQLKHFVADYLLQGEYMLGKFKPGWDFVPPLAVHCFVHAVFTFFICSFYVSSLSSLSLAAFDFVVHFVMDRIKASPRLLGRFKPDQPEFWWSLGFDQCVHHLTHYIIIIALITN